MPGGRTDDGPLLYRGIQPPQANLPRNGSWSKGENADLLLDGMADAVEKIGCGYTAGGGVRGAAYKAPSARYLSSSKQFFHALR